MRENVFEIISHIDGLLIYVGRFFYNAFVAFVWIAITGFIVTLSVESTTSAFEITSLCLLGSVVLSALSIIWPRQVFLHPNYLTIGQINSRRHSISNEDKGIVLVETTKNFCVFSFIATSSNTSIEFRKPFVVIIKKGDESALLDHIKMLSGKGILTFVEAGPD